MDKDEAIEVEMAITPAPETNSNIDALTSLFNPFPFTRDVIERIQTRREAMSNSELIIDLLLEQACIAAPQTLFPPSTPDILQALISTIALCPWDMLKKSALYFYLLSFMSQEVAQRNTALPPHFAALAYACFLLDQGGSPSLQRAVALLGDARIVQDLAPKVLQTLELADEPSLVRTYVRTAQPVLHAFEDAAIYVRALLDKSLADAWVFQRGFPEGSPVRNKLVRVILDACLMPTPHSKHLQHLLSLPLSPFEFSLLQAYALSPPQELPPSGYTLLQDLITVRLLSSGKYSDAIRISKSFSTSDNQLVQKYAGTPEAKALARAAAVRKTTMQDVLNVLPAIQRRELEMELNETTTSATTADGGKAFDREADEREKLSNSMTMSWEDLGMSTAMPGRAGQLEGSPAPGMSTFGIFNDRNVTRTPLNKMTASIFLDSPMSTMSMSASSPLRTPKRSVIPPPLPPLLKPSTPLGKSSSTGTTTTIRTTIPKPTPILSQSLTQPNSSTTSFAEKLSKVTRFDKPGLRFNIEPLSTTQKPSSGLFNNSTSLRSSTQQRDSRGRPAVVVNEQSRTRNNNTASTVLFDDIPNNERSLTTGNLFASTSTTAPPPDELALVESDDPDAFVIRRRKSYTFKSPPPPQFEPSSSSPPHEEPPSSPSIRVDEPHRRFPGAFGAEKLEEEEEPEKQGKARRGTGINNIRRSSYEKPASIFFKPPSRTEHRPMTRSRIQVPGALFDEDSQDEEDEEGPQRLELDEDERQEEEDDVGALPPTPAFHKRKTRARSSATSVTGAESGDDGDASATTTVRLRRSSRLSSAEPTSPQKKRTSKKTQKDGSTTRTRKRKNVDA